MLPSGDKELLAPIYLYWLSWNPINNKVISKSKEHQGKRMKLV